MNYEIFPRRLRSTQIEFRVHCVLSLFVFCAAWTVLATIGDRLFNQQEVLAWLLSRFRFLNVELSQMLVNRAWHILVAVFLSVFYYRSVKSPARFITEKLLLKRSGSVEVTLHESDAGLTEYILLLPGSISSVPSIRLTNSTFVPQRIDKIELKAHVFRTFGRSSDVSAVENTFRVVAGNDQAALRWKRLEKGRWVIDTPFALREGETKELPALSLEVRLEPSKSRALAEARKLTGNAQLGAEHQISVWLSQGEIVTATLNAAVRVFLPINEDEDGGVDELVRSLAITSEESRKRSLDYQQLRRETFSLQEQIAAKLNEWQEAKVFESLGDELEPLDAAIAADPQDAAAHHKRARVFIENGLNTQALASLDAAIDRGTDTYQLQEDRAVVLQALGRVKEASAAAEHLLLSNGRNSVALAVLAWAKSENSEDEAALGLYDRAIAIDASRWEDHLNRGDVLARLERVDEALAAFRRALELNPASGEAHVRCALWLTERGRDKEVLEEIASALANGYTEFDIVRQFEGSLEPQWRKELWRLLDEYDKGDAERATTPEG